MTKDDRYSWHPTRDGYGDVLGPKEGDGFPMLGQMTYKQACDRYGDVVRFSQSLPVTVDRR